MTQTDILLMMGVICGIGSALIAASKDRSIPGFFFLGFFLGVLGLIFAACVRSHRRPFAQALVAAPPPSPAGWFDDPYGSGGLRWFDGMHWGPQTAPHPQAAQAVQPRPDFPADTAPPKYRNQRRIDTNG